MQQRRDESWLDSFFRKKQYGSVAPAAAAALSFLSALLNLGTISCRLNNKGKSKKKAE